MTADDALLHCIRLSQAKFILSTPDIASVAYAAQLRIEKTDETSIRAIIVDLGFSHATSPAGQDTITRSTPTLNSATTTKLSPRDLSTPAVLIYTSGTTGKPKACSIKFMLLAIVSCPTAPDTAKPRRYMPVRTYSPMPLFHGTTFFIGLCQSVGTSGCFCLARRFSVSNYWRDVVHARATRILYVGELCRILLATPAGPFDRRHVVEVACGNGMKSDVWTAFQTRFNIPEVREFYRSTEGLVKFDNRIRGMRASSRGVGKLGFRGFLAQQLEKDQFIVRFDHDTDAPYRDPTTGFCVLAGRGKPGEAIARIKDWPTYLNYHHNEAATEAKIIRNVFVKGDVFQKSGDLMVLETSGWVRFVDRVGDTFRWKGENVSAGEIREYLLELPQVADAIVTGKSLESYDGQAGVAVLIPETTTSTKSAQENMDTWIRGSLYSSLRAKGVPAYAFPRLVAVTEAIQMGDTFKHAKQFVNALDWTPNVSAEPGAQLRYWLCGDKYLPLQAEDWQAILEGKAKL